MPRERPFWALSSFWRHPHPLACGPHHFQSPAIASSVFLTPHQSVANSSPAATSPFKDRGDYAVYYTWIIQANTSILRLADRIAILILSATLIPLCGHYSAYHDLQDAFQTLSFRSNLRSPRRSAAPHPSEICGARLALHWMTQAGCFLMDSPLIEPV